MYKEYQGFKIGTKRKDKGHKSNADYVKLAVLEKPPSSTPDNVEDKMEAMHRFKRCGARVADEKASHVTPVDLLKKGSERIHVVYGQAGSGKTTLLKQMCRALSCDGAESDFNLVLYFPLRERSVSSSSDLRSLLSYYLHDEDPADVPAMVKSLKENKNLLMVFDGADEVKGLLEPSSGSVVQRILQGRTLPDAHIIISSRPGACPSLQEHSASFYEVQGFDHAAITSYVKGFFEATPSAADTLKVLPEGVDDLMISLGKLAFNGLCHNPPLFIFDEPSIRAAFPTLPPGAPIDESVFKGLLHVHASRQGYQSSVSCSFPHTMQQEFFAALHLSHLPAKKQARFWQENLSNVSFSVVLRLYAGLTGLGVPKVAKQLHSTAAESHGPLVDLCNNDNPQLLFLFHALCESRNLPLTKEIMQHIPSSLEFWLSLSAFDTMAIAHCLSQCSHLRLLNLSSLSCSLLSPQCLSHLTEVLQRNPQCQLGDRLDLSCDHFSAGGESACAVLSCVCACMHMYVCV